MLLNLRFRPFLFEEQPRNKRERTYEVQKSANERQRQEFLGPAHSLAESRRCDERHTQRSPDSMSSSPGDRGRKADRPTEEGASLRTYFVRGRAKDDERTDETVLYCSERKRGIFERSPVVLRRLSTVAAAAVGKAFSSSPLLFLVLGLGLK